MSRTPVLVLSALLAGCHFSDVPKNALFQCDQGACPAGFSCQAGFCVATDAGGGGTENDGGCVPLAAQIVCGTQPNCGVMSHSDGCGGERYYQCGACAGGTCVNNLCCPDLPAGNSDADECANAGFDCGVLTRDHCGRSVAITCNSCGSGFDCVASDLGMSCIACQNESDEQFCYRLGATCGSVSANDNCGKPRTVKCGLSCDDPSCDGGQPSVNTCQCVDKLASCSSSQQCCSWQRLDGGAGEPMTCQNALCCVPMGGDCFDDSDCCNGVCVQGQCPLASVKP
ncbi:MAG: hypothetical protein QM723_30335 [Myxococcaceae bacterium]